MAATFGKNQKSPSYSMFAVPDSVSDVLAYHMNVSFLVRTRRQSGLIFFIGTNASVATSNHTFITIELSRLGVVSRVKLGDEIQTNVLPGLVADGRQHFVRVSRNYSLLRIQLDSMSADYTVNYSLPLVANLLYVGGIPSMSIRRRRRRDTQSDAPIDDQFSGTLQDFQLNGVRLQSFALNSTDEEAPSVLLPVYSHGVDYGEQSDDVCQSLQPCENNATCQTVFYNEYRLVPMMSAVVRFVILLVMSLCFAAETHDPSEILSWLVEAVNS